MCFGQFVKGRKNSIQHAEHLSRCHVGGDLCEIYNVSKHHGDISKAIREQGVASTNIARQVESIAQMSEENCAIAQSIALAAQEMAQVSHTMQDTVRKFKV